MPEITDEEGAVELGGGTEKLGGKAAVAPGKVGGGLLKFGSPEAVVRPSFATCPYGVAGTLPVGWPKCPGIFDDGGGILK